MKKNFQKLMIVLALVTTVLGGLLYRPNMALAKHKHPGKYYYYYYPAAQVYYSPVRRGYYFLDGGVWRFGPALPVGVVPGRRIPVYLDGPRPYVYHPEVVQLHPVVVVP